MVGKEFVYMLLVARAGEAAKSQKKKTAALYLFSIVSKLSLIYNNTYSRSNLAGHSMHAPVWLLALGAAHSTSALRQPRINAAHKTSVRAAPGGDDAASLFAEAARLRREAAEAERDFAPATEATTEAPAARPGLSVVLPIARPDWSVEDTECFFEPRSDGSAQLIKFEVEVPCGVILQESDDAGGRPIVVVGAVGEGSNAEAAGLRPGDILRATSAVRQQMEMPTWQLLGGGIGRPKTFRFIFGADLDAKPARDFEEVLGAVGSNRLDPQGRPAILVVERPA